MTENHTISPVATTRAEALAKRKLKRKMSLIDYVEPVHLDLIEDEEYRSFYTAVETSETVTGSLHFDAFTATGMIIAKAHDLGITAITSQKPAEVNKARKGVLRRYNEGRKDLLRLRANGNSPVDENEE